MRDDARRRILVVGKVLVLLALGGMTILAYADSNQPWVGPVLMGAAFFFAFALVTKRRLRERKSRRRN